MRSNERKEEAVRWERKKGRKRRENGKAEEDRKGRNEAERKGRGRKGGRRNRPFYQRVKILFQFFELS